MMSSDTQTAGPLAVVPVGLRVEGRAVLVVGAGRIAARKAEVYAAHGAVITVVAPDHSHEMDLVEVATRQHREFLPEDLDGMWLAVTATGIPAVDGAVYTMAEARRIWCNAADDPKHCSVLLPAVSRRGPITVGIATGGSSPAVASWLRRRIDALVDKNTLAVAEIATKVRTSVKDLGLSTEVPGWAEVLDNEALALIADDQPEQLERRLFDAVVGDRSPAASGTTETVGAKL